MLPIKRIFGICKIIVESKKIPIASSVYFNKELNHLCKKIGIIPIFVERTNFKKIIKKHKTYKNNKNVVGKDIFYPKFKKIKLINDNTNKFVVVDVKIDKALPKLVTLEQIKNEKKLSHIALVKQGRLSVMPIDKKSWICICKLGGLKP